MKGYLLITLIISFLLFPVSASANIAECAAKAEFYYNVSIMRDRQIGKVDLEQHMKNVVVENDMPLSYLDDYLSAINYVYAVNLSPKQIAETVFKECINPSKRI